MGSRIMAYPHLTNRVGCLYSADDDSGRASAEIQAISQMACRARISIHVFESLESPRDRARWLAEP